MGIKLSAEQRRYQHKENDDNTCAKKVTFLPVFFCPSIVGIAGENK